ncbi:Homeodomain-like protein [Mucor mucedo]|uniref:Homeodomain-like protein n=1 Tax=Mucor mucedo TaxID=29922 RepID=UPI0022203858|nr:Homeodomain-like protein [Mucor mucedo]KAI7889447.1 Homeodomain-like protein [Mucor mucedo]
MSLSLQRRFIQQTSDAKWVPWEDDLLRNYVAHNGTKWHEFVQHCLPNRTPNQCQTRWSDILNPTLTKGPFSLDEKNLLKEGVSKFGKGQWAKISEQYLPKRSSRRIANEWYSLSKCQNARWTKEEDELVLKGVAEYGYAWTRIAAQYLPERSRSQIRNHYRSQLDPNVNKEKWEDDELDTLLRRTIVFGQDWNKVAEGLPGRTPEKCSAIWMSELDPTLNKGPWTNEETRLFWERVDRFKGDFVKVAEDLPGRNRLSCFRKFWSTVRYDEEFTFLYGDALEKQSLENGPLWRARVAKLVCNWLKQETTIQKLPDNNINIHQTGHWDQDDLVKLDELVNEQLQKKGVESLGYKDWKKISKQFFGRDAHQCKNQYDEHLSVSSITKGEWSKEEDDILLRLVNEYSASNWDTIAKHIPNRNKRQCVYRWHRVLKFKDSDPPIIKKKQLSDAEKSLIKEGIQMFGCNWAAIRMTYLPSRTPEQIMRWWHFQHKTGLDADGSDASKLWTEDEDKALKFAVSRYKDELDDKSVWAQVSKMIHGRTPKQCRVRWTYTLKGGFTKGHWNYEEEMQLLEIVQKTKLQRSKSSKQSMWSTVAKELNTGRSDLSCRSKYMYMQRKGHRFAF